MTTPPDTPTRGGYRTILIDPPWPESGGGRIKRGADRHYPLIPVRDMARTILTARFSPEVDAWQPAHDAHLYLWATNNYLPDAFDLIRALGFEYKTLITWAKDRSGLGQYFRGQTEHALFAVRGSGYAVRTERKNLSTLITAPRGRHSAKPNEAHELIEARSLGPRLEMFAREPREGWESWGNEV